MPFEGSARPAALCVAVAVLVGAVTAAGKSELAARFAEQEKAIAKQFELILREIREFRDRPERGLEEGAAQRAYKEIVEQLEEIAEECDRMKGLRGEDARYAEDAEARLKEAKRLRETFSRHLPGIESGWRDFVRDLDDETADLTKQKRETTGDAGDTMKRVGEARAADADDLKKIRERLKETLRDIETYRAAESDYLSFKRNHAATSLGQAIARYDGREKIRLRREPWQSLEKELGALTNPRRGSGSLLGQARKLLDERAERLVRGPAGKEFDEAERKIRGLHFQFSDEYPGIREDPNRKWLLDGSIAGERLCLVTTGKDGKASTRYRILVHQRMRDEREMRDWLVDHAEDLGVAKFNDRYGDGAYDRAMARKCPEGWHIHHRRPLYVGQENGGLDDPGNYELIRGAVHLADHRDGGRIHNEWGPSVGLYRDTGHRDRDQEIEDEISD